jgi:anti-sigma regulatory factor (Ser/Thr protein kinase)
MRFERTGEQSVSAGLRHEAFVYDSDHDFVTRMAPFIDAGLADGEATLAVTTQGNWASLRKALGPAAEQVTFADRDSCYVRPARAIAAYETTLRQLLSDGAASVRVIAEVQFGPTPEEWDEWTAYEAIANRALADHPAWIVCPYDARSLPEQVVEGAWRTHPQVLGQAREVSPHFDDPEQVVRALTPDPGPFPELLPLAPRDDLAVMREHLASELAAAEVPEASALNMLLAAKEIVANAWQYAGGPEAVRVGVVDGEFVCEISDAGPGFDDPLAGYLPPRPDQERGAGLWIARQLVSRVELSTPTRGLTVRLWL